MTSSRWTSAATAVVTVCVTLAVTWCVTRTRDRAPLRDTVAPDPAPAVTAPAQSAVDEIEQLARDVGMLDERGLSRLWESAPETGAA